MHCFPSKMCWVNAKGKENGGRKYKQGSEAIPKEHASKGCQ